MPTIFNYGIDHLTVDIALDIAAGNTQGVLNKKAVQQVEASHQSVQDIVAAGKTVYG